MVSLAVSGHFKYEYIGFLLWKTVLFLLYCLYILLFSSFVEFPKGFRRFGEGNQRSASRFAPMPENTAQSIKENLNQFPDLAQF